MFEKLIRLTCDAEHCERHILAPRVQSVQLARRSVREHGWSFTQAGGDRCELHPTPRYPRS